MSDTNHHKETEPTRILHVDDDSSMLEITKLMLSELDTNLVVDSASGVNEALCKIIEKNYDAIISDYEMPTKNGLEFLKELKEKGNDTPFILFTGKGREEVAIQALNLGADHYVNKQGSPETVYGELSHGIHQSVQKRKAEKALCTSEANFRAYLESSPVSVFVANRIGKYEYVNLAATKLLGFSREELLNMTVYQAVPKEDADGEKFNQLKEKGYSTEEIRLKRKNGSVVDVFLSARILPDGKLVGFCQDITERKKAEEKIRSNEKEMATILDSSPMIIFQKDITGKITHVNEAFAQALNMTKDCLLEKNVFDIYPLEIAERMTVDDKIVIESKQPKLGIIEPYQSPNGLRWIRTHKVPTFDENGDVNGLIGFSEEITEYKQVQDKLKQTSDLLENIGESVDAGLAVINRDYNVVWANKRLMKLGVADNKKCYQIFNNLNIECPDCGVKKIFEGKVDAEVHEYKTINSEGETTYIELRAVPVKNNAGKVIAALELAIPVTERSKFVDALADSEAKYRALVENADDSIVLSDLNGKLIYGNNAYFTNLGYNPDRHVKIAKFVKLHPDDKPLIRSRMKELTEKGTLTLDYRVKHKNGTWVNRAAKATVIKNKQSKPYAILTVIRDVTKQKQIEDELLKSQLKYRDMIEVTSDFIWEINPQGIYTYCSPQSQRLWGIKPEDLLGKSPFDMMPEEEKQKGIKFFLETISPPKPFSRLETDSFDGQGNLVTIETSGVPFFDNNGTLLGYRGISRDITERKKAEEIIQRSDLILQNSSDSIIVTDLSGKITSWNNGAENIFGYRADEIIGEYITKIVKPEEKKEVAPGQLKKIKQGAMFSQQWEGIRKDGSSVWLFLTTKIIKNEKNIPIAMVGFGKDMTEYRMAEEELRKRDKQKEIINQKLQVVGSLTRHDISNKLMAARANLFLLKKKAKNNPDIISYINSIEKSFDESSKIMEFSKFYEKIGAENPALTNVGTAFNEAVKLIHKRDVEIVNEAHQLVVLADSLLSQLFYNLIDNSLRHGKNVSKIQLSYVQRDMEIKLVYEDNGIGIPQENKLKIFSGKFTTGGSGLGLKLVKRMIEVYGWTITEEGIPGQGAKFIISIPK
jgi:PAS domain S-box-containing protein